MKIKKYIVLVIVLLLLYFIANTMYSAGVFKKIENTSELTGITFYESMPGPEDLDIDRENGWLFISSADRRVYAKGENPASDGIYLLDLNKDTVPYKLETGLEGGFHPHGISYITVDGVHYLFVINHNHDGSTVEKFIFDGEKLLHEATYKGGLLCCPNDIAAVGENKFYVTNDHGTKKGFMRVMEDYLRLPKANLIYFDGLDFSLAYPKLKYANGIVASSDGKTLYLTETTGGRVDVLSRDVITGKLEFLFYKDLNTGFDNINIDEEGNLWVAAHPKLFAFVKYAKGTAPRSPSEIFRLTPENSDFSVKKVYENDGSQFPASSVALFYRGKVYAGCVFAPKVMVGTWKP